MDIVLNYDKTYIHSTAEHVPWDQVNNYFKTNETISADLGAMKTRYKKSLDNILKIKNQDGSGLSFLSMEDREVEILMQAAAEKLNEITESVASQASVLAANSASARTAGKVFSQKWKKGEKASENEDFNLLMKSIGDAIRVISTGSYSQEIWDSFVAQYGLIMERAQSGRGIKKEYQTLTKIMTSEELKNNPIMIKVMRLLANIPMKYKQMSDSNNGITTYTAKQMMGTLNNIFGTTLGEEFGKIQLDMLNDVTETCVQGLGQEKVKNPWGKTKVDGKVDVAKNGVLDITITSQKKEKEQYQITGSFGSSIKLYSPKGKNNSSIGNIDIQSIYSYVDLVTSIFDNGYFVYNALAFNNSGLRQQQESFKIIRSSVLARYFIDFLSGSGQALGKTGFFNTAEFLVINGHFYSIFSIIIQFIDEMEKQKYSYGSSHGENNLISINYENLKNNWVGDSKIKNIQNAFKRSSIAVENVNKIRAKIVLNVNSLMQYANSQSIIK